MHLHFVKGRTSKPAQLCTFACSWYLPIFVIEDTETIALNRLPKSNANFRTTYLLILRLKILLFLSRQCSF